MKLSTRILSLFAATGVLIVFGQNCSGPAFQVNGGGSSGSAGGAATSAPWDSSAPNVILSGYKVPNRCTASAPASALAADVSRPNAVVGNGTVASCTFSALKAAVVSGGVVTFNCGSAPVTIPITSTLNLSTSTNTVIDGGSLITLDGQSAVQIFNFNHGDFMVNSVTVTLQHLSVINGKSNPTQQIPTAPAPCSQGWNDGQGGAIFMRDGNLNIIDCVFANNQAALLGPDVGGGAIYIVGSKNGLTIVNSVFINNKASNGGAVGGLFAQLNISNSLFQNNIATGNGANNDEPSKCAVINNGQHETGSGGNGGAIYQDGGSSTNVVLCGDDIVNNQAGVGAFGGGVFMTSNDFSGSITVQDSIVTGNTGGSWTVAQQGGPNLGTAFGVNAKTSTVKNSTLQH